MNLNSHVVVFELKLLISFSLELKIKLSIKILSGFNIEWIVECLLSRLSSEILYQSFFGIFIHVTMCLMDRYSYESDGKYLVAGSEDGNVIVVDGRASVNFRPIGYTCKKINCHILQHLYDFL